MDYLCKQFQGSRSFKGTFNLEILNYLSVENISKRFGEKELFKQLSFGIEKGQKVALLAKNGSGKTTLLNLLFGYDTPDAGQIIFRKDISVAYLHQEDKFDKDKTVLQEALNDDFPDHKAIIKYTEAVDSGDENSIQLSLDEMNKRNAWDADVKLKEILSKLKLDDLNQKVGTLSGGQKKRLALARLLSTEPDFMILDEPTNHLDMEMIEWLEAKLVQTNSTILMVTHDRYFLELICTDILEMDRKSIFRYQGNFSDYLTKKQERDQIEQATISKAKNLYRTELEWMRRMPKARGTKQKSRIDSFYKTEEVALTKISDQRLEIKIKPDRLGGKILEFHKVSVNFDNKELIKDFSYVFKKNEKVGIIGPNGVGKTTLLRSILGEIQLSKGKIVSGETVKYAYYAQSGMQLKEDKRVIEVIRDIAEYIPADKGKKLSAAQMLELFLFSKDMHYQYVSTLSGGEKKRLYLLTILMQNPNFLILDEPTNDLDIYAMSALEDYLLDFEGCLITVSHDRYFLDKLTDHLFVFRNGGEIKDFPGNYSQYLVSDLRLEKEEKSVKTKTESQINQIENSKKRLSYKEKREFETLSKEIETLESEQVLMNNRIAGGEEIENPEDFYKKLSELAALIENKTNRWLELSEFI